MGRRVGLGQGADDPTGRLRRRDRGPGGFGGVAGRDAGDPAAGRRGGQGAAGPGVFPTSCTGRTSSGSPPTVPV
ncbi:hypothetical protein ACRAWD_15635 [Caulobacter segnis]